jgi:putative molybdenum carrier protein
MLSAMPGDLLTKDHGTLMLKWVISGGQTGADRGALIGARRAGVPTGGTAPKGWITELGPAADILKSFGMIECWASGYPPRTIMNVRDSGGTVIIGNPTSPGCKLTIKACRQYKRPYFCLPYNKTLPPSTHITALTNFIRDNDIATLNVAGNRETRQPGLTDYVAELIAGLLS